jgi:hypothetical protein
MKICKKCNKEKECRKERLECKDCEKKYREDNKKAIAERNKQYKKDNKEKVLFWNKKYREANKEKITESRKKYLQKNKDRVAIFKKKYQDNKRKNDSFYSFKQRTRNLIKDSFSRKKHRKNSKSVDILGCSLEDFKIYIQSKFTKGMNLENHGMWHLDHIIPLATAKTEEDVIRLNHYTNFQPLWAKDNLKKSDKIIDKQLVLI